MSLAIVYRYGCDFPACDQFILIDFAPVTDGFRDAGWRMLPTTAANGYAFELCPHHAETDTTAEDLERIAQKAATR